MAGEVPETPARSPAQGGHMEAEGSGVAGPRAKRAGANAESGRAEGGQRERGGQHRLYFSRKKKGKSWHSVK